MSTTIYRLFAAALWSVAFALMLLGLAESQNPHDFYAWAFFLALVACVCTGWLITEHILGRGRQDFVDRIALAVGYSVQDQIENERDRQEGHQLTPVP